MIEIVSIEDGVYYSGPYTSGSTLNVTLTDGTTTVRVEGVLIFEDDEESLEEMFWDAMDMADAGEEGYVIVE